MSVYITGCEKDAEVFYNNDLTTHNTQTFELREEVSNYHPYYLEIYKVLLEKDSQTGFSNRFISELGVPLWNKMIVFDSIPHQIFTITPIVDSVTEKITGLLKVSRFNDKDFYEVIEKSSIQNRINNINGNYINLESLKTDIAFFNIFSWNVFYHSDPDYNNLSSAVGQINLLVPRNVIRIILPYWVWEDCCYEDGDRDCHSPPGSGAPGHWVLKYRVFFVFVPGDSDWTTESDEMKIKKIIMAFKMSNYRENCSASNGGQINLEGLFDNLPSSDSWGSEDVLNSECINASFREGEELSKIRMGFVFGGPSHCVFTKPSHQYDYTDDGIHYNKYQFKDCESENWNTVSIRVLYGEYNIFQKCILDTKDWKCPN